MRRLWLTAVAVVGFAGCQALLAPAPAVQNPSPTPPLRGEGLQRPTPPSLSGKGDGGLGSPSEPDDPLALAARCLEQGDNSAACTHLDAYVRTHPEQIMFRAQLAELLLRVGRLDDAKAEFERFVADAQAATGPPRSHLVHCHTRLMEIGVRSDDRFAELFHRAVGLLLLVREQDADPNRDAEFREEILCKAVKSLAEAKELRPLDPRVHVYLAEAYDGLGNPRAADAERAAARRVVAPGSLTRVEQRRLSLSAGP